MTSVTKRSFAPATALMAVLAMFVTGCGIRGIGGIGGVSQSDMIFPGEDWVTATPESQGLDSAKLQAAMQVIADIAEDHKNGTRHAGNSQVLVIRNGRVIWHGDDIDNRHSIHSCGKSFMSAVFGLLVDDGKCTPDTLAADIIPELKEHYPQVTLGQFANFTSGYNVPWRKSALEIRPPIHAPGEAFHYSGSPNQLAQILTRIGGVPIKDLFEQRIANPIGMSPEDWSWREIGEIDGLTIYGGSGHISITARQFARFGHLFLNRGNWNGRQLISEDWVKLSTAPQVSPSVPPYDDKAWYTHLPGRYGYNWWTNGVDSNGERWWRSATAGTFAAQGNLNNYCFIIPEWDMVLVRMGAGKAIDTRLYEKVFAKLREAFIDGTVSP